jgi:copper transport protein
MTREQAPDVLCERPNGKETGVIARCHTRQLWHRTLLRTARALAVVALAFAAALPAAAPASAHATLSGSNPSPGAILTKAPATVTLHFDEAVTTVAESLRVLGPDGNRADAGTVHRPGDGSNVAVDLKAATKKGSYFVSWRVVSADSHPISGAFTFSVGVTSKAPASAATTDGGPGVAIALGLSRWMGYLGLVLMLGGAVFLAVCWRDGWQHPRARRLLTAGWGLGMVAALLGLGIKGPFDAGLGLSQTGRWDLDTEVLATTYGKALVARVVLLAGIAIWFGLRARMPALGNASPWAGALVSVGLLATFAATGHASAGSGQVLAFPSDMLHLAAMAAWVGGLIMLATVLLPGRQLAEVAHAVPVFSRLASVSVAVLVATGTYQSWRQVGSFPALSGTTYGRELLVKLALVGVALSFGAASRIWVRQHYGSQQVVVHALSATDVLTPDATPKPAEVTPAGLRTLRRGVAAEAVIALLILAVTSGLVATAPARTAYRPSVESVIQLGPDTVHVSAVPAGDRAMDLNILLFGPNHEPTNPEELTAALSLPAKDLGPLPVTLRKAGAGHEIATLAVPVPGDWTLTVSARTTAFDIFPREVILPIR